MTEPLETPPFRRWLQAVCAVFAMMVFAVSGTPAAAGPYIVFDASSGEVLAENRSFDPWYPASLTKLMTIYVAFRALGAREIKPETPVVMSAYASREPPSKMGFKPGTMITVDDALKILVVKSANDVAMALAETVGGTEEGFVARMNAEARRLGMAGTQFANPNGLPDERQWTTARDYAILTYAILKDFPSYRDLFRITALQLGGKVIKTHNHLLERYPGSDGMKTGFICASGFNVVASASRGNRRLVAVVLGERNAKLRAEKTAQLLETGFSTGSGLFSRRTTIAGLRPAAAVPAGPTDMRDFVCGKNRKAGEDADADVVAKAGVVGNAPKSYLVPAFKVMDPVAISILGTVQPAAPAAGAPAVQDLDDVDPLPRPNPRRSAGVVDQSGSAAAYAPAAPALEGLPPPPDVPPIQILGVPSTNG